MHFHKISPLIVEVICVARWIEVSIYGDDKNAAAASAGYWMRLKLNVKILKWAIQSHVATKDIFNGNTIIFRSFSSIYKKLYVCWWWFLIVSTCFSCYRPCIPNRTVQRWMNFSVQDIFGLCTLTKRLYTFWELWFAGVMPHLKVS